MRSKGRHRIRFFLSVSSTDSFTPMLEIYHESRLQHHVTFCAKGGNVLELQQVMFVDGTENVVKIFRIVGRRVEHHLVVVLQLLAQ